MVGKIVNVDQLGFDEASRIEGDWSRFSDDELAALSSSKNASSIRNELESGDIALIVDSPSSPMLSKMENGFSVSQQNAPLLSDYGVKKIGHRFSGNYYGGTVAKSGGSLHPAKPMPTYIPEPVIKTQPSIYDPIKISDNLSKPKTNKIFAKSCSQPFGNTEACQKKESLNNAFRFWGMFFSSAEAFVPPLPITAVAGAEITLGAGAAQNKSINGKTALALTKVVGNFKDKQLDNMRFSVETSPVMSVAVMLFKALQFGDKTQYTEDELRNMEEVQSRIRVQITEPVGDNVYPTVQAYHVDDTRIPVRYVSKNEQAQYSVALEENGPTIYWSPDETGNQVPHTTPSQDDGVSFGDIWVNPLSDAVNDPSTVLPMPAESDWQDRILVFPEDSGIEPLYVVFSKTAYSAAYKTKLKSTSYPGVSRARHFQESNENLLSQMENDSDFKKMINDLGIDINRTPRGLAPRRPPIGWTWHHEKEKGVMILVPRKQHTIGSDEWKILHLDNKGGYSRWGKK